VCFPVAHSNPAARFRTVSIDPSLNQSSVVASGSAQSATPSTLPPSASSLSPKPTMSFLRRTRLLRLDTIDLRRDILSRCCCSCIAFCFAAFCDSFSFRKASSLRASYLTCESVDHNTLRHSLRLVSPAAATQGVAYFSPQKNWWPFYLVIVLTFLAVVSLQLPASDVVYPVFFLNSATKIVLVGCHTDGVRPSPLLPSDATGPQPNEYNKWILRIGRRGVQIDQCS